MLPPPAARRKNSWKKGVTPKTAIQGPPKPKDVQKKRVTQEKRDWRKEYDKAYSKTRWGKLSPEQKQARYAYRRTEEFKAKRRVREVLRRAKHMKETK
jgi:hypothetical protein